jgi:hypothetical protein
MRASSVTQCSLCTPVRPGRGPSSGWARWGRSTRSFRRCPTRPFQGILAGRKEVQERQRPM